jgi:hypothetical protein
MLEQGRTQRTEVGWTDSDSDEEVDDDPDGPKTRAGDGAREGDGDESEADASSQIPRPRAPLQPVAPSSLAARRTLDEDAVEGSGAWQASRRRSSGRAPPARPRAKRRRRASKRVFWTDLEVGYLKDGVERYGHGEWAVILQNYDFLETRTNVNLKDKWRNLVKNGLV